MANRNVWIPGGLKSVELGAVPVPVEPYVPVSAGRHVGSAEPKVVMPAEPSVPVSAGRYVREPAELHVVSVSV